MQSSLLTMAGVQKRFGSTLALRGVDLSLARGEILALIGENGAGKSTLMKVLSGAHRADSGEMTLEGKPYRPTGPMDARRLGVAMIYQELSIAPDLSVAENIMLGVEPDIGPFVRWGKLNSAAREALAQVGRTDIDVRRRAGDLSIAEQQMVEIARTVSLGAKVLVLDEPTSSLTRRDVENLFTLLRRLRDMGLGIVYISHFLEEVRQISSRFLVLRDGASVGGGNAREMNDEQITRMMVGRDVTELYPRSPRTRGQLLLSLEGVSTKSRKVRSASLELHRGEVLGIAGLVGAGRSELLRGIFGLDQIRSGKVRLALVGGTDTGTASPRRRWSQGIGMVSEDRKTEGLALGLSIADNLTITKPKGLGPLGLVLPSRKHAASNPWIDRLMIRCQSPSQPVSQLSGGNQQKVAIARLLHHDADVFLLDEPTRGVDIGAKAQIYQLIDELARGDVGNRARGVIVVSSYLPELLGICDRIAVMNRGMLGDARDVSELDEHKLIAEAISTSASPDGEVHYGR